MDDATGAGGLPGPRTCGQVRRLRMLASLMPGGAVWLKGWMKLKLKIP